MINDLKEQILKDIKDHGEIEIYVDYRDFEDLEYYVVDFKNIDDFCDNLYNSYQEVIFEYQDNIIIELSKKYDIKYDSEDFEELKDIVCENLIVEVPIQKFLNKEVRVNILTNFYNELNSDFISNGWLRWIMKSQGYKLSDYPMLKEYANYRCLRPVPGTSYYSDPAKDDWNDEEIKKYNNKFLKSILQEVNNQIIDYMRTFTFLATITVEDYFRMKSGDYKAIKFNKDVMCGLYNPWNGSGSLLEVELEKDVTVQKKNIYQVQLEGIKEKNCGGYKVDEVYGLVHSCWKSEAKLY